MFNGETNIMDISSKIKEFNVPVPWGHIAVKAWGDEKDMPILVVHGRMDNAGVFDRLIPLLPNSFYYICIDLPGHGKSSHFPPYTPLYTINYLLVYKLIMQYFKRDTYIIIGHSYGGHIGFLFARLYPHYVEKLIMLDCLHHIPVPAPNFKDYLIEKIESNLLVQKKLHTAKQPTYTYEEAFKKFLSSREGAPLIPEAAKPLLQRGIEPTGNGKYKFTLDQRMKCYIDPLHDIRYSLESMKTDPISCPVLSILATRSMVYHKPFINKMDSLVKKGSKFSIKCLVGTHDIHNNYPEMVAPHIEKFLLNKKGKL